MVRCKDDPVSIYSIYMRCQDDQMPICTLPSTVTTEPQHRCARADFAPASRERERRRRERERRERERRERERRERERRDLVTAHDVGRTSTVTVVEAIQDCE